MSILVTGGAGYIGSHMVHELADASERVVVLDSLSTGFDWAVANGCRLYADVSVSSVFAALARLKPGNDSTVGVGGAGQVFQCGNRVRKYHGD